MSRRLLLHGFRTSRNRRMLGWMAGVLLGVCGCASRDPGKGILPDADPIPSYEQFDFTPSPAAVSAEPATEPGPYRLGVGDVLHISVYGEDDSLRESPVDPTGNITYMMVGSVSAAGRTLDELRADLQTRISTHLNRGIINVIPVRFGSQTYTILGELNYPGTYLLQGRTTVLDAIAAARGIRTGYFRNSTAEMADFQHATLMREGVLVPLDFEGLLRRGDASQNVELHNGDILTIPSSLVRSIYVLGEVNYPRTIGFFSSVSLMQALTEARGLKSTSDGRIVVVRGSLSRPEARVVSYPRIIQGQAMDIRLAPGDIVYVPPRRLALLREIVQTAISAYVNTVSAETASELYRRTRGGDETAPRPIIVPSNTSP